MRPMLRASGFGGLPKELEDRRKRKAPCLEKPHLAGFLAFVAGRLAEAALPERTQRLVVIGFRLGQGSLDVYAGDAFGFQCSRDAPSTVAGGFLRRHRPRVARVRKITLRDQFIEDEANFASLRSLGDQPLLELRARILAAREQP